jgi:TM2 domain-containing membrane protein YozV
LAKKSQKTGAPSGPAVKTAGAASEASETPVSNPQLAAFLAWVFPGAGHFYLGDRRRGLLLGGLLFLCLILGCRLEGLLMWQTSGSPLLILGTIGSAGAGLPFFALRFLLGYEGDPKAAGYEYGASFLLTAGLLNWLLVLDAWDRAWGRTVSFVDGSLVDGSLVDGSLAGGGPEEAA